MAQQISAAQLRAARAWLEISQVDLAERASVGRRAIADFERGARSPYVNTLQALQAVLESLGIEFLFEASAPVGVKRREPLEKRTARPKPRIEAEACEEPGGASLLERRRTRGRSRKKTGDDVG